MHEPEIEGETFNSATGAWVSVLLTDMKCIHCGRECEYILDEEEITRQKYIPEEYRVKNLTILKLQHVRMN